jgi:hypothetical protein
MVKRFILGSTSVKVFKPGSLGLVVGKAREKTSQVLASAVLALRLGSFFAAEKKKTDLSATLLTAIFVDRHSCSLSQIRQRWYMVEVMIFSTLVVATLLG